MTQAIIEIMARALHKGDDRTWDQRGDCFIRNEPWNGDRIQRLWKPGYLQTAESLFQALSQAGYVVVPAEMTEDMTRVFDEHMGSAALEACEAWPEVIKAATLK